MARVPSGSKFEPAYLALYRSGELQRRAAEAVSSLAACRTCPRACAADRQAGKLGTCQVGRYAQAASYFPHHGEEDCLRGWRGSGTIFFAGCGLRCRFCQNWETSQGGPAPEHGPEDLAEMMLALQAAGCHNINFVTPSHVVPQILEALVPAVELGLRLPLVYNTSGYDTLDTLRLLDGVIDIYMPDFKFWDPEQALRYVKARDYPEVARAAIREMHRQVGALAFDEHGLALRGVLVRHLVMPGDVAGTPEILRFLAGQVAPDTYVNVMAQYRPAGEVGAAKYPEINRPVLTSEYAAAVQTARALGLRLDGRRRGW